MEYYTQTYRPAVEEGATRTFEAQPEDAPPPPPRLGLNVSRLAYFHNMLLCVMIFGLGGRALYLQGLSTEYQHSREKQKSSHIKQLGWRGVIFDRNDHVLANSVRSYLLDIQPHKVTSEGLLKVARRLPQILPKVDMEIMRSLEALSKVPEAERTTYQRLFRHATPEERAQVVKELGKFVNSHKLQKRVYPKGDLAGSLLGHMPIDSDFTLTPVRGVELSYEALLRGLTRHRTVERDSNQRILQVDKMLPEESIKGSSLRLTIDMRIQQITEAHLNDCVRDMNARAGVAVIMDPHNGDILAMAQSPSYDPNLYNTYPSEEHAQRFSNHAIESMYEPGSTVKPLLVAAALNEKVVSAETMFSGMGGAYNLGGHTVSDTHALREMNTLEVIQHSSNVGAIQIATLLGRANYYNYLIRFGFGASTEVGLEKELPGRLSNITDIKQHKSQASVVLGNWSYGYGFSATPLQMAQAISVIANGGNLVAPRIVREIIHGSGDVERFPVTVRRRVVRESVTKTVTQALVSVVEAGTGKRARVDGYVVAGKTGTTEKFQNNTYKSGAFLTSFIGFAPAENPRFAAYIIIDDPKNESYGGTVAAPVFSKISKEVLPYLGVPPTRAQKESPQAVTRSFSPRASSEVTIDYQPWWSKDRFFRSDMSQEELVPDLKGKDFPGMLTALKELNADVEIRGSGVVVSQTPEAGELLPRGRRFKVQMERPAVVRHSTVKRLTAGRTGEEGEEGEGEGGEEVKKTLAEEDAEQPMDDSAPVAPLPMELMRAAPREAPVPLGAPPKRL